MRCCTLVLLIALAVFDASWAQGELSDLDEAKARGVKRSGYLKKKQRPVSTEAPEADLLGYRKKIEPLLREVCLDCHGPDKQKSDFRIDTLDPDLVHGEDASWWLEVVDVISNGEMPPEDEDAQFSDEGKADVIDWLSNEIQVASQVVRSEQGHSSFRRMTRYEYNYALQDLLGLPYAFAEDLPPETPSEDGFLNSSEMLQMSAMQFETYREMGRQALKKATVRGEQPEPFYYGLSMEALSSRKWKEREARLAKVRKAHGGDPKELEKQLEATMAKYEINPAASHFKNVNTGQEVKISWSYGAAKQAPLPTETLPELPTEFPVVAIVPSNQSLTVDVRDTLPDSGNLRIRILASSTSEEEGSIPSLRLIFGHQASNNSKAEKRVSDEEMEITASPDAPEFYEWEVPLSEVIRNPYRGITELGTRPNPAEYVKFLNTTMTRANIRIDYIEITAPAYDQWPPRSHQDLFIESEHDADELVYAREVLANFMPKAWRRSVTDAEIDQKVELFENFRSFSDDFQGAMIEVMAGVLASPKFLYLVQAGAGSGAVEPVTEVELATRLSMFLWSSVPDQELLALAESGELKDSDVLIGQVERLLEDPRAYRFSRHFVRQWLGMQLLDYLEVDKEAYPRFDDDLKAAMQEEPIAFFSEVLHANSSVMDFLHADYVMANERLAHHYEIEGVYGGDFQKVLLPGESIRGGLLTQAGLLAMNSDGKDSHPLKRGIWLLENLLHDPPPPPPPAVPEIDLTDPDILKLTLKERMEDHRSDPACFSCHAKIDPWGIAFENFDAAGSWRTEIGKKAVDANSVLFNKQELHGMDGLKVFLLENRQDQFARAMVHKLTSYALGRPLSFADRAEVEQITGALRRQDDGLASLITLIVESELFRSK